MLFKLQMKHAIRHIARVEAQFKEIFSRHKQPPVFAPPKGDTPYQALFRSIVYQQLSGKAAETILRRVLYLCKTGELSQKPLKRRPRFPKPAEFLSVDCELLRKSGLSRAKLAALIDLSEHAGLGKVPTNTQARKMSDLELIESLTQVRGIGVWSVQMFLIFHLGRLDVWPCLDLGVRKGYAVLMGLKELPPPKHFEALGERFKPYRSVAAWYCWRALEHPDLVGRSRL